MQERDNRPYVYEYDPEKDMRVTWRTRSQIAENQKTLSKGKHAKVRGGYSDAGHYHKTMLKMYRNAIGAGEGWTGLEDRMKKDFGSI